MRLSVWKNISRDAMLRQRILLFKDAKLTALGLGPELCLDDLQEAGVVVSPPKPKAVAPTGIPYGEAIDQLRRLGTLVSPIEKCQLFGSVAQTLCECVDNSPFTPPGIVLAADDLLLLFAYLVIKANLTHLWAEVAYIRGFLTTDERDSMAGYYLSTFEAAAEYVMTQELIKE